MPHHVLISISIPLKFSAAQVIECIRGDARFTWQGRLQPEAQCRDAALRGGRTSPSPWVRRTDHSRVYPVSLEIGLDILHPAGLDGPAEQADGDVPSTLDAQPVAAGF